MSTPTRLTLRQLLFETTPVIHAHTRHFSALSLLFILPVCISAVIYPFIFRPTSNPQSQIIVKILYTIFAQLFSISAIASITYSTFHGYYNRPVEFIPSLKSIPNSFFPLLATQIVTQVIILLISLAFVCLMLLAYGSLYSLGVDLNYGSPYFLGFVIIITILLLGVMIYFQVEWCLSNAVVVLESRWGFSPLKRSSVLVKGKKRVAFCAILLFGIPSGLLSYLCFNLVKNGGIVSWGIVLKAVAYACFLTILSLYGMAANTVLFVHCNGDYVSLPVDDVKASYV